MVCIVSVCRAFADDHDAREHQKAKVPNEKTQENVILLSGEEVVDVRTLAEVGLEPY